MNRGTRFIKTGRTLFGCGGWRGAWAFVSVLVGISALRAHDPGLSTAQGELRAQTLEITVGFAPADALHLLPPETRTTAVWSDAEFARIKGLLDTLARELLEVKIGGAVVAPRDVAISLGDRDSVNFQFIYPRAGGRLTLRTLKLGELPPGHRQFGIVTDERGSTVASKLLSAADPTLEIGNDASAPSSDREPVEAPGFRGFLWLGIEHIWTGYDHLLFLSALLIVCRSFRSIVAIVSCFTLAHSLTLALATLDLVTLPAAFVEPAIAGSIVYVGAENLWRRGAEPAGRWALTFAFGLIHGFGFASVLRDLGVGAGRQGILMPLFTFNLGVEVGQILIAAVVLPIVWRLRKNEAFVRRAVPALSGVVVVAGLYWLIERTLLQ